MDRQAEKAFRALGSFVSANESTITQTLYSFAEKMIENAQLAQAEYDRGQVDPQVKAAQDASMFMNNGYKQAADMARTNAEKARWVAEELTRLLDVLRDAE